MEVSEIECSIKKIFRAVEVLQALKARGIITGILSNGDPSMLAVAVKSAGLDGLRLSSGT